MLCLIQLESVNAKLKQKLSNFPTYFIVLKPIDPPNEAYFNSAKTVVYEAKLEATKLVSKENQEYLTSNNCCDFLDSLLSIISKTLHNFIAKNKNCCTTH